MNSVVNTLTEVCAASNFLSPDPHSEAERCLQRAEAKLGAQQYQDLLRALAQDRVMLHLVSCRNRHVSMGPPTEVTPQMCRECILERAAAVHHVGVLPQQDDFIEKVFTVRCPVHGRQLVDLMTQGGGGQEFHVSSALSPHRLPGEAPLRRDGSVASGKASPQPRSPGDSSAELEIDSLIQRIAQKKRQNDLIEQELLRTSGK